MTVSHPPEKAWKGSLDEVDLCTAEYLPLRTVSVILKNGNKSVRINALLDDGAPEGRCNAR